MDESRIRNLIRIVCLIAGVAMIIFGASHGEAAIVLRKAVKVCLECIGLG